MKIAIIGLRLTVGPRLIVDTLAPAFKKLGVEVVFVGERSYVPPAGVDAISVSDGSSYTAMLRDSLRPSLYREVAEALVAARPDVCYFVSLHAANALLAVQIRRALRPLNGGPPPMAMHIHDPLPHPGVTRLAIFAAQQLQARTADYVVTYGAKLAEQVNRYYAVPMRRIVTIRHGASRPPRETAPEATSAYRWFSFLGRIEPYKGLDVFLNAARVRLQTDPSAQFFVGGAGDLVPYQKEIQDLGDRVIVENRELTNDETDEVMRSSWAVVLPYHTATQSGVIPIAYWNACPVIVTRAGALAEMVREGETGFIVEPGDVASVAERMRAVSASPQLRWRLGGGAFAFYDRWLRWERIADDLVKALAHERK